MTVGEHLATLDSAGISSPNQPNLEILGSQISLTSDQTHYQVKALVGDLRSFAPGIGAQGTTLVWSTQWKVPSTSDPRGGAFFPCFLYACRSTIAGLLLQVLEVSKHSGTLATR